MKDVVRTNPSIQIGSNQFEPIHPFKLIRISLKQFITPNWFEPVNQFEPMHQFEWRGESLAHKSPISMIYATDSMRRMRYTDSNLWNDSNQLLRTNSNKWIGSNGLINWLMKWTQHINKWNICIYISIYTTKLGPCLYFCIFT